VTHASLKATPIASSHAQIGVRRCMNANCERPARRRGRTCGACATKRWREKYGEELAAHEAVRSFSPEQTRLRNARGYLSAYLRRGRIQRTPCQTCGSMQVTSYFPDLAKPLEVIWYCKPHRVRALDEAAAAKATAAQVELQSRWKSDRERFADEFPRLSPEMQAQFLSRAQAIVALNSRLAGVAVDPQAPLVRQAMIRLFVEWREEQDRDV